MPQKTSVRNLSKPDIRNATQAAIRAGYSEKGARVRGAELLANRNVGEAMKARAKRTEVTANVTKVTPEKRGETTPLKGDKGNTLKKGGVRMGRRSTLTPELAGAICRRIAEGESLRTICRDQAMPSRRTVLRWCEENAVFCHQYACAREAQADTLAEEVVTIADDDAIAPERAKVRIDARKWLAAKVAPKRWGDKTQLVGDGGGSVEVKAVDAFAEASRKAREHTTQTQVERG